MIAPSGIGTTKLGIEPFGTASVINGTTLSQNIPNARTFDDNNDYNVNANFAFISGNWVEQAVLIALATTKGTMSSDINFGNEVPTIEFIDDQFEQNLKSFVTNALSHLIPKTININSINIDAIKNGRVYYTVDYYNNYTKKTEEVSV
jgi:phage baseplate assembly protein W